MSSLVTFAVLGISGGIAAVRATRRYLERRRVRQTIRDKPALEPATPDGSVVRVTGIVRATAVLQAPLSGRACVVHRSRVRMSAPYNRGAEAIEVAPFLIDRGAEGPVLVDGSAVQLDVPPILTGEPNRLNAQLFLRRVGIELPTDELIDRTRYEESIIEPGQRVTVAGLLMLDAPAQPDGGERDYRESARPRMRITGNDAHPLAIGQARD